MDTFQFKAIDDLVSLSSGIRVEVVGFVWNQSGDNHGYYLVDREGSIVRFSQGNGFQLRAFEGQRRSNSGNAISVQGHIEQHQEGTYLVPTGLKTLRAGDDAMYRPTSYDNEVMETLAREQFNLDNAEQNRIRGAFIHSNLNPQFTPHDLLGITREELGLKLNKAYPHLAKELNK